MPCVRIRRRDGRVSRPRPVSDLCSWTMPLQEILETASDSGWEGGHIREEGETETRRRRRSCSEELLTDAQKVQQGQQVLRRRLNLVKSLSQPGASEGRQQVRNLVEHWGSPPPLFVVLLRLCWASFSFLVKPFIFVWSSPELCCSFGSLNIYPSFPSTSLWSHESHEFSVQHVLFNVLLRWDCPSGLRRSSPVCLWRITSSLRVRPLVSTVLTGPAESPSQVTL